MSNPPPRGTPRYRQRVLSAADADCLDDATPRLHELWQDYGWRSTIDVMTEWVVSIDFIMPPTYRDFTGTVDLTKWGGDHLLNQEKMLEHAVRRAQEDADETGVPVHEAFGNARKVTDRLLESIEAWRPVYTRALSAAHQHHDRDPIRAVLSRGPGVRERDWWTLRDGAAYLYQVAHWPITAARQLGRAVRPPDYEWAANDLSVPPHLIVTDLPEGNRYDLP